MAHLIVLRHLWVLRRDRPQWLLVNGLFEPFLYLISIGVGIGQPVNLPAGAGPPATTYAAYVAPALLATSAMNAAFNAATGGVWFRIRFEKIYQLPLDQSTELLRGLSLGELGQGLAWAALYLTVMGIGGLWLADRRLPALLLD